MGGEACMTPLRPPMVNMATKVSAIRMGVVSLTEPPYVVEIQLKILMPVGTAISIVLAAKNEIAMGPRPVVNIWCAHTVNERNAIAATAYTMKGYPKSGLREK